MILLIFAFHGIAISCGASIDSLKRELFSTDNIEKKISIYLAISKHYEESKPDSAQIFWKEALNLAQRFKSDRPLAEVYSQAAFYALKQNQLDRAFLNFTLATKYFKNVGDQKQYVRLRSMLGSICLVRDEVSQAMTYYIEVIDMAEKLKLYTILPHVLNNVGNIFMASEDYSSALGYYIRALELFRKINDSVNIAYPLINLAECYYYIGSLDQSWDYASQTLKVANRSVDNVLKSRSYMLLGMVRGKQKDYPGALNYLEKSLQLQKETAYFHPGPSNIVYSEILEKLGQTWFEAGNIPKALYFTRMGNTLAKTMKQTRQAMITSLLLSKIHESQHRLDSSLFYYKLYNVFLDSLSRSGDIRAVKMMEIRQEFEKKQQESQMNMALAKSTRRTILIVYISSGIVLLAVIFILFLMLKIERQKKRQSEIEKQGLHEKLEFQNKELTTNVMYLTRMNELVVVIAEKLKKLEMTEGSENARIVRSIIRELEMTSNPDNWKEFELRFQQVNTDFYRKLGDQFPDLTPNELKLCAFLKLNMSTKEISAITFQSQNSIMVARSRLRQKLGISKDENLVTFLSQL